MVRAKDTLKMFGVMLLAFGAAAVGSLFVNYYLDLSSLEIPQIPELRMIYEGQLASSKITAASAGGLLGLIALIILLFSAKRSIDENESSLGILKALGHSERTLATPFLKFGYPVFAGTLVGYALGMLIAPSFYNSMNTHKEILPQVTIHWGIPLAAIVGLSMLFSLLAYCFARLKLKKAPLDMIKGARKDKRKGRARKGLAKRDLPFLKELKRSMRVNHPVLSLFVGIAAWGFSAMLQMSFTMMSLKMVESAPLICAPIGIMMGFVTLIIAGDFVVSVNRQYISLMKAYGYSEKECYRALLDGYRPVAWLGFALGGPFQYFFMKWMVSLFTDARDAMVGYNLEGLLITLVLFVLCYEGIMHYYRRKVSKVSLKEVMLT